MRRSSWFTVIGAGVACFGAPGRSPRKTPDLDRGADGAHVDDLVLDPVEVAEAMELRDPDVDRRLAAFEPGRMELPARDF